MADSKRRDIVVIGGSAGGVSALEELTAGLPRRLDASVFIVLHLSPWHESTLPHILTRAGTLPAVHARDGEQLEKGKIYIAPPDRHVELSDGRLRVARGPTENRHRPSIDVLFRSAAQAHGRRVIGVLLTGADDDGAAGLKAIKECGGVAIVQDPADSRFPEMPLSAMRLIEPDYKLPASRIGAVIARLTEEKMAANGEPSPDAGLLHEDQGGTPSGLICPDCGGSLWELDEGGLLRYRCRVGHAYSTESMFLATSDSVERALWAAVRALEESADLSRRVGRRTDILRDEMERKARTQEVHAREIRKILAAGAADAEPERSNSA